MGLHVTSVAEISGVKNLPEIKYFVYFLNYYQFSDELVDEFLFQLPSLEAHFSKLGNAVLVSGIRNVDFYSDVLSWHNVVGLNPADICPCLLNCSVPPSAFIQGEPRGKLPAAKGDAPWVILELRKLCSNAQELRDLLKSVVEAFARGVPISEFEEGETFQYRKRPIIHGKPKAYGIELDPGALWERSGRRLLKKLRSRRLSIKDYED